MAVVYFGNNDNGDSQTTLTADYRFAIRSQCGTTGNITEVGINLQTAGQVTNFRLGIYADSAGPAPGSLLLDAGEIANPASTGWNSKTGLSLAVTSGAYYWIAFNNSSATDAVYYNSAKNAVYHSEAYGALGDPYGSPTAFGGYGISLRAGVEAGGAAAESDDLFMLFES